MDCNDVVLEEALPTGGTASVLLDAGGEAGRAENVAAHRGHQLPLAQEDALVTVQTHGTLDGRSRRSGIRREY